MTAVDEDLGGCLIDGFEPIKLTAALDKAAAMVISATRTNLFQTMNTSLKPI
ncbi:hypothetical protein PO124_21840 [Bacillus licheniformis]|nr:hypothetical protein [Bacillus licheniformis]